MNINLGARSLNALFLQGSAIEIPSFQRNYSWTKSQINQFLSDVYASAERGSNHFWGPIVTLKRSAPKEMMEIIDGQQRITTAVIMLSLLRDQARKLVEPMANQGGPGQWEVYPAVRNFLFQAPTYATQKFRGSYLISDILAKYVIADPDTPTPNNGPPKTRDPLTILGASLTPSQKKYSKELRAAYRLMTDSLQKEISAQPSETAKTRFVSETFMALTQRFEIYTLELTDENDAFVLFESLNDRGLKLNPADILKTVTLNAIRDRHGSSAVETALDVWDDSVESLGDYDFTKFLRHHLLTKTDGPVQNRRIIGEFRARIDKLGEDGAHRNLEELERSAALYAHLLETTPHPDHRLKECFARMSRYSDTHRIFLLGMLGTNVDLSSQRKLARAIEYLSFRWIACGRNAQQLETLYQAQARLLLGNTTTDFANTIVENLIAAAPEDERFGDALVQSNSTDLMKYVLFRIEESQGGGLLATTDLEHLAPQRPGANRDYWTSHVASDQEPDEFDRTYDDYVDSWGNVTLLESRLNQSIKNAVWETKISGSGNLKGLTASNYRLNEAIKDVPEWTATHIRNREAWIKRAAVGLVSAVWVRNGQGAVEMWNYGE
jgi:hypothetical protein